MESEQERLGRLYRELGDEHLLDMAENQDDLTDAARFALAQELQRRGIVAEPPSPQAGPEAGAATVEPERETGFGPGIPGMFPAGAPMMEQALELERTRKDGLTSLISFYDGIELSKACAILEDAQMEPSIEAIDGDAMSGVPPRFEIWLDAAGIERAKTLLRARMGLFPLAEVDEQGDAAAAIPADQVVAEFDSAEEAGQVQAMLVAEGFAAWVEEDAEAGGATVLVPAEEHEHALHAVAEKLGMA
jgi:hypothetical protein